METLSKVQIAERLAQNIARVKNLVDVYEKHLKGQGSGRRGYTKTDVLRAATVLLHATVEDLLRNLAYSKLPNASPEVLDKIPLVSAFPSMKYSLGALAAHRGKTVDEIISASVKGHLERSNYNSSDQVGSFLTSIGIDVAKVNSWFPKLDELMKRRHQIVHRADRDETGGSGRHRVRSIGRNKVREWIDTAESFCKAVLDEITA